MQTRRSPGCSSEWAGSRRGRSTVRRGRRAWSSHGPGAPKASRRRSACPGPQQRMASPRTAPRASLEGMTAVHAGPVVEQDRDHVLGIRTEVVDEEGAESSLGLPGEQVQAVPGLVGSQPAPFSARIIGVDAGRSVSELGRSAPIRDELPAAPCRRPAGGWTTSVTGLAVATDQTEQGEGIVDPQPQRADREHATSPGRQRHGRRGAGVGVDSIPPDQAADVGGQRDAGGAGLVEGRVRWRLPRSSGPTVGRDPTEGGRHRPNATTAPRGCMEHRRVPAAG